MSYLHTQAEWRGPRFFLSYKLHSHVIFYPPCLVFFLSVLPTLFHFPFFDERQHSGLVSVDANDYDDDFYTFFYSFSRLFTDNPFPCPPTPSPIPNYSKKEKAWGRAHLPQMSDECVATRDPHSSPPPSALTVYRHPQSLTDDVSSHRFRFRYLRFRAILWTFFYFTDVFFLMSGIEGLKKIDKSEAFSACKMLWLFSAFILWYLLEESADAGPPNGNRKLFSGLVLSWMDSVCSCCKWAANAVAVVLAIHWQVVFKKKVLNLNSVLNETWRDTLIAAVTIRCFRVWYKQHFSH